MDKAKYIENKVTELNASYENLDETIKLLLTDLARTYAWLDASCLELEEDIDNQGYYVEWQNGTRANPAIDMYAKLVSRKQACIAKMSQIKKHAEADEAEAIEAFLG